MTAGRFGNSVSTIWAISQFDDYDAPHWGVAYIEADTAEEAKAALLALLSSEDKPDTVWADEFDPNDWDVREVKRPFRFVLGKGCR